MNYGKIILFVCLCVPQFTWGMVKTLLPHNYFQQHEVHMRVGSLPSLYKNVAVVLAIQEFTGRIEQFFSSVHRVPPAPGEDLSRKQIYSAKLFNAVKLGQQSVVQELLQKVSIKSRDGKGNTPLMWAVYNDDTPMVKLLLRYKDLDINAANDCGHTALMWATWYAKLDTLQLLLRQPTLLTQKRDHSGYTAIDWACEVKGIRKEVVQLLFKHDQKVVNHCYYEWRKAYEKK